MTTGLVTVPIDAIQLLYPLMVLLDSSDCIACLGPTMAKIAPDLKQGDRFDQHFTQVTTGPETTSQHWRALAVPLVVFSLQCKPHIKFRAVPIEVGPGKGTLLTMSFYQLGVQDICNLGISIADFSMIDPVFDYMMLSETQAQTLEESRVVNQKLASAKVAAEAASRAKSQFLAKIGHEVRTPMTAVMGFVDMLIDKVEAGHHQNSASVMLDWLRIINDNALHLMSVLDDVLDFARIESGKVRISNKPTSISLVLIGVHAMMHSLASSKGLEFMFIIAKTATDKSWLMPFV